MASHPMTSCSENNDGCIPVGSASFNNIKDFDLEDIVQTLTNTVNATVNTAVQLILSDVGGEFFYPNPRPRTKTTKVHHEFLSFDAEYKEKSIDWVTIQDFSVNEIFTQVRDFINLWHLSDATKFTLGINDKSHIIPRKGTRYFLDAIFSKPTPVCPNPLAVAKVFFTVIVPQYLPKHYPIKVIYRFEGYSTHYHANGPREMRTKDFQRYFIDSILQRKLVFYAKIFECRHPHIKLNKSKPFKENDESEEKNGGVEEEKNPVDDMNDYDLAGLNDNANDQTDDFIIKNASELYEEQIL
ncbi:PREDICTED: uncharacterized protein LOC108374554 [Rhagoletis zephyria]|uniref:uncharacterized protein LOC108374554 n=1 Tax=Rhagoletis zephyria TaxID=28612 RepID=UPI00081172BD|nr:PREDICTED: uncharacterized protein LOC108374554 [Rhagoletis zephyria]